MHDFIIGDCEWTNTQKLNRHSESDQHVNLTHTNRQTDRHTSKVIIKINQHSSTPTFPHIPSPYIRVAALHWQITWYLSDSHTLHTGQASEALSRRKLAMNTNIIFQLKQAEIVNNEGQPWLITNRHWVK